MVTSDQRHPMWFPHLNICIATHTSRPLIQYVDFFIAFLAAGAIAVIFVKSSKSLSLSRAVAGLSRNAVRVIATSPGVQTFRLMLFRWRTPPRLDLFESPLRSFLRVVSVFPNGSRKANGNLSRSNGCSTSVETAPEISTSFIPQIVGICRDGRQDAFFRNATHVIRGLCGFS